MECEILGGCAAERSVRTAVINEFQNTSQYSMAPPQTALKCIMQSVQAHPAWQCAINSTQRFNGVCEGRGEQTAKAKQLMRIGMLMDPSEIMLCCREHSSLQLLHSSPGREYYSVPPAPSTFQSIQCPVPMCLYNHQKMPVPHTINYSPCKEVQVRARAGGTRGCCCIPSPLGVSLGLGRRTGSRAASEWVGVSIKCIWP